MKMSPENSEVIKISKEELSPLTELHQIGEPKLVCLNTEKNLWVKIGMPESLLISPEDPHVFIVDKLKVTDKNHKGDQGVILENVPVILAHGYRDEKHNWRFANRQPVVDTVKAFNQYAGLNNLPRLEFIIACQEESTPDELGIKIKDIPESEGPITQVIGTGIGLAYDRPIWDQTGKLQVEVSTEGEIWGLDDLTAYKKIKLHD